MDEVEYCQSCGMPITEDIYGTDADGKLNTEYCKFCYEEGNFKQDFTMQEMIDFCIPLVVQSTDMDEQSVTIMLNKFIPQLKRWKKD